MQAAAEDAAGITPRAAWVRASPSSQLLRLRGAYPSRARLSQWSRSHAVDSVKAANISASSAVMFSARGA